MGVKQDELAEQTLKAMCRKFSESAKIWLRHIAWLLAKDRADAARKVLDKSFAAVPQRKHIKVSQAQLGLQAYAAHGRYQSCYWLSVASGPITFAAFCKMDSGWFD